MKRTEGDVTVNGKDIMAGDVCIAIGHGPSGEWSKVKAEHYANAHHIAVTWNASKGMTTKQAGLYLEHGKEMVSELRDHCTACQVLWDDSCATAPCDDCNTKVTLTAMEGE